MSQKIFTTQEVAMLKQNPHVKSVSIRSVVLTKECKEQLYKRINRGEKLSEVLDEIGLDSEVLGQGRVLGIIQKLRTQGEREAGFESLKKGKKDEKEELEKRIKKLEIKLEKSEQLVEFLKKTKQLNSQKKKL